MRQATLAIGALAVVAIVVAGSAVYQAVTVKETLIAINETVSRIEESQNRIALTIEELQGEIDELSKRVSTLESSTVSKQELDELAARLQELSEAIASLQASSRESAEAVQELAAKLEEIAERLSRVEELVLFPVEVVDGTGETIVINQRPERIVSLAPAATEILYYVNATDRLVGVDEYSDWPEWIREARENGTIVNVGGFWNPSVEAILSAEPDLVVGVAGVPSHESIREIMAAYGIPVVLIPQESLEDIARALLIVGKATGNVVEASIAAGEFRAAVARVTLAAPADGRVSVALLVWINPAWVAGNDTFQSSLIEAVGGVNAFSYISGWAQINPEDFLNAKPDVIIAVGIPVETVYKYFNETLGEDAASISAIAEDRVYCIGDPYSSIINRPSPRIVSVLTIVQLLLYPEIYGYSTASLPACVNATTLPSPPQPPLPPAP